MLHGILNMPPGIWDNSDIHKAQRHDAYKQASKRIKELEIRLQIDTLNPNRREHIVQQDAKIAELEQKLSSVVAGLFSENDLAIRDLEQQARGIEDLILEETSVGRLHSGDKRSFIFCQDAKNRILNLQNYVKALKDQG
jgi:hypothetical protein